MAQLRQKGDLVRVNEYVDSVLSGALPSCEYVILACLRWKADLARRDLYFDESAFLHFTSFSRQFKHYKGPLSGQSFEPEDWQLFIAANIFGLKVRATGFRKYTYADVLVPRKNGKTFFVGIIALYMLLASGESGPEVYTAAVDRAQASLCFDASKTILQHSIFKERVKFYRASLEYRPKAGVYKPLSKETKNKDGLNPYAVICDERHAWLTNEMLDVIKTGMGARSEPLLFSISTAGIDTSLPYYRDIEFCKDILHGIKEQDNHFIMIYCPDEGDRWDDPKTWYKVNPNLGVSLSYQYMASECAEAKQKGGSTLVAFLTKNLNLWTDAPDVWIADDDVIANNDDTIDISNLEGEEVYVGIDLASKTDISAVCLFFPKYMTAKWLYFLPETKISGLGDRVDYRAWLEAGWIIKVPGKVLDEDWFVTYLLNELGKYQVKCIAYDPWGMWNVVTKFSQYQDVLMEYPQLIRYMSVPTKWLESAVLSHALNFGGDPVIRWMFKNVVVYIDANANIKLDKARSRNKIDGVVALVDAIGGWLNSNRKDDSGPIYEDHELRVLPSF